MADQLQIIIGADTAPLQQGLNAATKAVDAFDKNVKKTVTSSGQATLALSNLGRVASDAPFGFIAIANNIEPLIQSFQSLGKTSGGIGQTLKALGASLIGPGGLLLGFSLVSSAVTVAVQKYGSLGNAVDALFGNYSELDKQVQEADKSFKKFGETVQTTTQIQQSAAGNAQGEIARVQALSRIISDSNRSYNERNTALKELKRVNKDYFGDLDLEATKIGELQTRIQDYSRSIIAQATTKAFADQIAATTVEFTKQRAVLIALTKDFDAQVKAQAKGLQQGIPGIGQAAAQAQLGSAVIEANGRLGEQNARVKELRDQLALFRKAINESVNAYVVLNSTLPETATNESNVTNELKKGNEEIKSRLTLLQRQVQLAALPTPQARQIDSPVIDTEAAIESLRRVEAASNAIFDGQRKQVASITDAFNNLLAPSIDAVFSALATGQNAFRALGDSLKQLVIQLVATVIKAAALAAIISAVTGTPFNVAFKGTLSSSQQLGNLSALTGGGRIGGAAAPSFPRGTAFSGGGMQLAGNVTFVQRGPDLVGVLNQGNARINRVG